MIFLLDKLKEKVHSQIYLRLFALWFLLFPFEANFLPVSIGFMTLYPHLLLSGLLLFFSLVLPVQKKIPLAIKLSLYFLLFWLVYGIAFIPFVEDKRAAIMEVRSLALFLITAIIITRTYFIFGKAITLKRIAIFSGVNLVVLIIVGFLEFFTSIHFTSYFTEDVIKHLPVGNTTFAPLFIFQNPNSYLVYLISFSIIYFASSKKAIQNNYLFLAVIFIWVLFSFVADAKMGMIIAAMAFLYWCYSIINKSSKLVLKRYFKYSLIPITALLFCVLTMDIYWGPMWKNGESYLINGMTPFREVNNEPYFYSPDSLVAKYDTATLIRTYREYQFRNSESSGDIRLNLIKNGLEFIKTNSLTGIGPAQFFYRHIKGDVLIKTHNYSPHNFILEIATQYGLVILILFLSFILFALKQLFYNSHYELNQKLLILFCWLIYFGLTIMPSAWLVLSPGWLLLTILFLISTDNETV